MALKCRAETTVQDAANRLKISRTAIYNQIEKQKFPHVSSIWMGKQIYKVPTNELLEFFDDEIERFRLHILDLEKSKRRLQEDIRNAPA